MFANEPAGGGAGAEEYLILATPFMLAALLSSGLFLLWIKGHSRIALLICAASFLLVVPSLYGWIF